MAIRSSRLASLLAVLAALALLVAARPAAAAGPTNDPESERQWGLLAIRAPEAWAKATGRGVSVAVLSSGIGKGHPDLAGKVEGGFDATGTDANVDTGGRGTHLAGIVGAETGNGVGIAGVARDARLFPYKAYETDATVAADQYLAALQRAVNARPTVVLVDVPDGFPSGSRDLLRQSLKNLSGVGISVVVGAQSGLDLAGLGVLPVAATTTSGGQASGSVGAEGVGAPGQGVLSTTSAPGLLDAGPTFDYGEQSGTAQAAAHAAGAVAILRSLGASAAQAADTLRATARKSDAGLGAGLIDVAAAVTAFRLPAPTPPGSTTTTKKGAAPPTTKPSGGAGVTIPEQPAATSPIGPGLEGEPLEPGEGEPAVVPPGAEEFFDQGGGDTGGPSTLVGGAEDTRPLGHLAVGFGLLCGVGTGLSLTFRRLADAPV